MFIVVVKLIYVQEFIMENEGEIIAVGVDLYNDEIMFLIEKELYNTYADLF